jgi:hypothetical protein
MFVVKVDVGESLIHREELARHVLGAVRRGPVRKQKKKLISVGPLASLDRVHLKIAGTVSEDPLPCSAVHRFDDVEDHLVRFPERGISVAVSL